MDFVCSTQAYASRQKLINPNSGAYRWRTPFLGAGTRDPAEVREAPMGFLIEMTPESVLPPHFHPVDQFQVFTSGNGKLGKHDAAPLSIHYADHHTAYGPITAGPQGIAYFTLRARNDARGMFLHKPGARAQLQPSKRRFRMVENITRAVPPVLAELETPLCDTLLADADGDGLSCFMLRIGANMAAVGPDPSNCGGQFYLIIGGSLQHQNYALGADSMLFAYVHESAPALRAGAAGCEILVLQFPKAQSSSA